MAQPTAYSRLTNFVTYALAHTSQPYNAAEHDAELDAIETTLDEILANLQLIQRDDGALKNASVHPDSLTTATLALIAGGTWTPRGLWVTLTVYERTDVVQNGTTSYVCAVPHTAGTFATDYAAGKWIILGETAGGEASTVTASAYGHIAATNVQAFLEELVDEKARLEGNDAQTFAVAAATDDSHAVNAGQIQKNTLRHAVAGGSSDAITATIASGLTTLTDGMEFTIEATDANGTTAPTFELTLGSTSTDPKTIKKGANGPLVAGDIIGAGHKLKLCYDLSNDCWLLLNPAYSPGASTSGVDADTVENLGLAFSVGGGAMTVTVKTASGGTPSSSDMVRAAVRSSSLSSATYNIRELSSAAAITIPSGATLGHVSTEQGSIHHYLVDNAGSLEPAVSTRFFGYSGIASTTAIDSSADSSTVMYSTAARTDVPFVWVGVTRDTQTVAGTWAATPTEVSLVRGDTVQIEAKGDLRVGQGAGLEGIKTAGAEGSALITDPAQTDGLQWVRLGAGSVRQSVLSATLDSSGYNAAITTGSGLRPGLDCTPNPLVMAFASGFGACGAQDLVATLSADVADILEADLPASNTSFLHATWVSLTDVSWGRTLVPPQYGYAFDRTKAALLNFEGADGSTAIIDAAGNTWTASGNAQLDTAQKKFGAASLLLDGTGDYITTTNIITLGDGSWELSAWFRINALPGVGTQATIFRAFNASGMGALLDLDNVAGTTKLRVNLSSNGTSVDIAGSYGTNTGWTLNQWNRVRLVFDALAGTYRIYLSLNGAAETQDFSISSTARICAVTSLRIGGGDTGTQNFNGWIDAFRFLPCATNTSAETPSVSAPSITDYPVHFFSIPEMRMYEVTAASVSAGTNPDMTRVDRLFVGEADTNATNVTAVRPYALRSEWDSDWFSGLNNNTLSSKTTNLGVPSGLQEIVAFYYRQSGQFAACTPVVVDYYAGADERGGMVAPGGRNTVQIRTAGNHINPAWSNIFTSSTSGAMGATGEYRIRIRRAF